MSPNKAAAAATAAAVLVQQHQQSTRALENASSCCRDNCDSSRHLLQRAEAGRHWCNDTQNARAVCQASGAQTLNADADSSPDELHMRRRRHDSILALNFVVSAREKCVVFCRLVRTRTPTGPYAREHRRCQTLNLRFAMRASVRAVSRMPTCLPASAFPSLVSPLQAAFVVNTLISVVSPFFPDHAATHFDASGDAVGLAIAAFPFASIIVGPIVSATSHRCGGGGIVALSGAIAMAIGTVAFGFGASIAVCTAARALQGAGGAAIYISVTTLLMQVRKHCKHSDRCARQL